MVIIMIFLGILALADVGLILAGLKAESPEEGKILFNSGFLCLALIAITAFSIGINGLFAK